jgi:hypothetical protein
VQSNELLLTSLSWLGAANPQKSDKVSSHNSTCPYVAFADYTPLTIHLSPTLALYVTVIGRLNDLSLLLGFIFAGRVEITTLKNQKLALLR